MWEMKIKLEWFDYCVLGGIAVGAVLAIMLLVQEWRINAN